MKKVAIIGAGQLGSRHLQGILNHDEDSEVYVVDPSPISLKSAADRAKDIEHSHSLKFLDSIYEINSELDLVIVATNSNVRFEVISKLLNHSKVRVLVLEKVLFQTVKEYYDIRDVFEGLNTTVYVNHPRRVQELYIGLKRLLKLASTDERFNIYVSGINWGLGCNALHVTDTVSFLFDDNVVSYSTDDLLPGTFESKRIGYKEFYGSISGYTVKGNKFTVECEYSENMPASPLTIRIESQQIKISLTESGTDPIGLNVDLFPMLIPEDTEFIPMKYQSELSTKIVEDVFNDKPLDLPSYEEAMVNHILFIESLLTHINKMSKEKIHVCPIT